MIPRQTTNHTQFSYQRIFYPVVTDVPFRILLILVSIALNQQLQYLPIVEAYAITKPSIACVPQQYIRLVDQSDHQLQQQQQQQSNHNKKVKYDLGMPQSEDIIVNIDVATQYLVEHESVNEFPSPLRLVHSTESHPEKSPTRIVAESMITTTATNNAKKRKQHPPLIPNRLTDDSVLKIVQHHHHHHRNHRPHQHSSSSTSNTVTQAIVHPQMINGHDFDINTAWIELLIHEQQMKLMTTTTAATV
jgi:hypothetical protein